ncbi:hypothetical protein Ga0100231_004600 [Opitutaceae bacterium TAV4]|nr:hypothetical protein Ga0100231_004600 [Opitutaceae bacterium TAV4]RRK02291.1 hypothetical protein Ga0100230_003770 [Opitutaceae bacterium TAV3]
MAQASRPHSDVAQASRLQSSLLREAPHSIKVTALRAIDKMAGRMPALRYGAGVSPADGEAARARSSLLNS